VAAAAALGAILQKSRVIGDLLAAFSALSIGILSEFELGDILKESDLPGFSEPFIPVRRLGWGLNDIPA